MTTIFPPGIMQKKGCLLRRLGIFLLLLSFHPGDISASTPGPWEVLSEPPVCSSVQFQGPPEPSEANVFDEQPEVGPASAPYWTFPERIAKKFHAVPAGKTVRFRCQAAGNPHPSIYWLKDGKELMETDRLRGIKLRPKQWSLIMENVGPFDGGLYTCIVRNRYGVLCHSYYLEVTDTKNHRPILEAGLPANQTVMVGSDVEFHCKVYSDGKFSIQWLKTLEINGSRYGPNGLPYVSVLKNANETFDVLHLHNVTSEDAGEYICLAGNINGIASHSAWLRVLPEPQTSVDAPFTAFPDDLGKKLLSLDKRISELEKHVFGAKKVGNQESKKK